MEESNKKNLYQIFLCFLVFQAFALLALSANFLLAETPLTFNIAVSTENNATDISGNANFYATSSSSDSTVVLSNLGFYFFPVVSGDGSYYGFTGTSTNGVNWSANIDTSYWPSGSYDFYAKGYYGTTDTYDNTPYISNRIIINVNNETAATDVEITARTENDQTVLQDNVYLYAYTNVSLNNLIFYLDNLNTTAVDDYSFSGGVSPDLTSWSTTINTGSLPNGQYEFYAKGFYNNNYYDSANNINITIDNATVATAVLLSISFYEDYSASTISGTKTVYAIPSNTVDKVDFKVISSTGASTVYAGTKDTVLNKYYFSWNTATFANGTYTLKATAYKGTETADIQKTVAVYNAAATTALNVEFVNLPPAPFAKDVKIQIKTNLEPTSVKFEVKGPKYMSFSATKIDANNYYFLWKTAEFPDGEYLVYAFIEKGTEKIDRYTKTSVNNSTATTTPTVPITVTFVEKFTPPLSGDQKISISTDQEIYSCVFKIEGPKFAELTGAKDSSTQCHILLRTSDFPNGDYVIRAIAGKDSLLGENKLSARIENQISSIEPTPIEPVSATEPAPTDTTFISQECKDKGFLTIESCQKYFELSYECRKANIFDLIKCKEYLFKQAMPQECLDRNAQTQEECEKIMLLKSMPAECQRQDAASKEECGKIMRLKSFLTPECANANMTNVESCNKYMADNFMPEECRQANVITKEDCDYLLRNKYSDLASSIKTDYSAGMEYFPDECRKENAENEQECENIMFKKYAPKECVEAQILNSEGCEKLMFKKYAPDECRQAGIANPEACKKYMFERYNGKENISADKFPIECQKAEVKTAEECEKVMKKMYMPKECVENGISDEKECDLYFKQKYMPKECQEKNAGSREECDKIMFKKFGPPECEKAGIENESECEKFMSNKYADKITCEELDEWQCKNTIQERHIGNIVAMQSKFEEVKEKTADLIGKTVNLEDLEIETAGEKGISPLKEKIGLKIVAAQEKLILNEEESLIQTSPVVFMIDSDGDELPDDVEKRIGTDPFNKDTDGDGHSDGEEMRGGYNPLGEGNFEKEISPIDKAILQNKIIEHPKTEGEEVDSFSVQNIRNIQKEQNNLYKESNLSEGYILSGKAEPNSVATLYIYSDLPAVMTVDVDEYGNWRYKLDQSLVDGEHEIYIAVNDDTGKVVKKSKPLSFFVKEASAVSVKDFVAEAKASSEESKKSETSISNYLLITIALAVFGIFLFLAVIVSRKKNQPLP